MEKGIAATSMNETYRVGEEINEKLNHAGYLSVLGNAVRALQKQIRLPLFQYDDRIPSLTNGNPKNRCIPCIYRGTAIFLVSRSIVICFFPLHFDTGNR